MTGTTWRLLTALGVLAAAAGWGLSSVMETVTGRYLPVPWTTAAAMGLLAVTLLIWALLVRPRLRRDEGARPLEPLVAARTAALAMAASRTGAVVAGVYVGIGLSLVSRWSVDGVRERVIVAGLTVLGSVALTLVALWLERMCRLPQPPAGEAGDDGAVRG